MTDLTALEFIDVRNNEIASFPLEVLSLRALHTLDLAQNSIVDVPTELLLHAPASLRSLTLSGNSLVVPDLADKGLSGVKAYLEELSRVEAALLSHQRRLYLVEMDRLYVGVGRGVASEASPPAATPPPPAHRVSVLSSPVPNPCTSPKVYGSLGSDRQRVLLQQPHGTGRGEGRRGRGGTRRTGA